MPTYLSPGVYVEELDAGSKPIEGVGTAVAAFVGLAATGPTDTPVLVTNWSQFVDTFGDFVEGSYLAHAVYGYFQNGGGMCYVLRIGADGSSSGGGGNGQTTRKPVPEAVIGGFRVRAVDGSSSRRLSIEVADSTTENAPEGSFKLIVRDGEQTIEEHDPVTIAKGRNNVISVVKTRSKVITLEEAEARGEIEAPPRGRAELQAPPPDQAALPATLSADKYTGDAAARTGIGGLEAIDEITMVCAPDLMAAYEHGLLDLPAVQGVQLGMIAHCELMGDRVAIIDPPPGLNPQQVQQWRLSANYDSAYAALYYPWLETINPATGKPMTIPPSGHLAGIWARNDDTRGVHKAPANEVIRGALAPTLLITKGENDLLNPIGVNCIRSFPGRGVRVWGARTMSSDPSWKYINIRRLFNFIEESILNSTQWVVFEPNDRALWAKIRRTIAAFLVMQWRQGALFGLTPDEAFYVRCDDETNTAESMDLGQVICEIGVAPVKPAEFVVFRLAQMSSGTSLVSE
jgi:phage tail sheath protein FI